MGPWPRNLLAALALVAAPAAARAGDQLPFSDDELAEALRVRVAARHRVAVDAGAGAITVTVDGRAATIVLSGERGPDAARLVALVAAELALEPLPAAIGPVADATVAAPSVVRPARAAAPSGRRWSLGARMVAPVGDLTATAIGAAGSVEDGGALRWSFGFGAEVQSVTLPDGAPLRVIGLPVRAGLIAGDRLAVGVVAIATPLFASGGDGATSVALGAGVHTRVVGDVTPALALSIDGGVDVMANEIEYQWDGVTVLATGRVRPWIAASVAWRMP